MKWKWRINKVEPIPKITHIRIVCTNCGCTEKVLNVYSGSAKPKLVKECYNCDPVKKEGINE